MVAQRVLPQMMGIMPSNVDKKRCRKTSKVFVRNELYPQQKRLKEPDPWIGEDVINLK